MKNLFQAAAIAAVLSVLAGCGAQSVLERPAAHVAVRAGVAEFIDGEADAARSVIAWTDEAAALLDGNPEILLSEFRDQAQDLIPWDEMSPGRQIIAIEVLAYVEGQIRKRLESGELPSDAKMSISELLATAKWAANFQLQLLE